MGTFKVNGLISATGTISASNGFIGNLTGNADSATILKPTDNLDTTAYSAGQWVPSPVTANNGILVWREAFSNNLLSPDTGDIVLWLSGGQQLNVTIDGHFWQDHDALVLDQRNFTSYVNPISISALGAKVEFGIWGMKDPEFGDNWIRTTSYGLLPYNSGGIGSSHSAIGESGWWFNNSWIETMHTNEIYLNAHIDDLAFIHTEIHDTMTFFDFNLCDDENDRFRWVGGLHNSSTGAIDWYESMVLTLQGVNNSLLRLNGVFSCNDAHVDNKLYVGTEGILVGGNRIVRHDGEGTNFNIYSGNGHTNFWEIDSYNGNLRMYTWRESDGNYKGITIEQETGAIIADKVYGAVWNDYAEYRICNEDFKPGQVVCENNDDTLSIAKERLQPGANIVSDTFGFAIGETDEAKCPIAVSGRVLAYTYEPREEFQAGEAVCAAPNGTVSRMTREEIIRYPERIIGTVSSVPSYDTWGTGNVKVDNRIWIKVK